MAHLPQPGVEIMAQNGQFAQNDVFSQKTMNMIFTYLFALH